MDSDQRVTSAPSASLPVVRKLKPTAPMVEPFHDDPPRTFWFPWPFALIVFLLMLFIIVGALAIVLWRTHSQIATQQRRMEYAELESQSIRQRLDDAHHQDALRRAQQEQQRLVNRQRIDELNAEQTRERARAAQLLLELDFAKQSAAALREQLRAPLPAPPPMPPMIQPGLPRRFTLKIKQVEVPRNRADGMPWDPDNSAPDLLVTISRTDAESLTTIAEWDKAVAEARRMATTDAERMRRLVALAEFQANAGDAPAMMRLMREHMMQNVGVARDVGYMETMRAAMKLAVGFNPVRLASPLAMNQTKLPTFDRSLPVAEGEELEVRVVDADPDRDQVIGSAKFKVTEAALMNGEVEIPVAGVTSFRVTLTALR